MKRSITLFLALALCLTLCFTAPVSADGTVETALSAYADILNQAPTYNFPGAFAAPKAFFYALVELEGNGGIPTLLLQADYTPEDYVSYIRLFQYDAVSGSVWAPKETVAFGAASAGGFRGGVGLNNGRLLSHQFYSGTGEGDLRKISIRDDALVYEKLWSGRVDLLPEEYEMNPIDWKPLDDRSDFDRYGGAVGTAPEVAHASAQMIELDGRSVELNCYALLDAAGAPTNYVRLRDLAALLDGTPARFQVSWDGTVNLLTGLPYTYDGTEFSTPFSGDQPYRQSTSGTNVNGVPANLEAIVLTDSTGGGYTYYKLRDLGQALGFNVGWDTGRGVFVESNLPYNPAN